MTVLNRRLYLICRAVPAALAAALGVCAAPATTKAALSIDTLRSVAGLPPHLVGRFGEPAAFQQAPDGEYFVFDRRGHTISRIDAAMTTITPLVAIGHE